MQLADNDDMARGDDGHFPTVVSRNLTATPLVVSTSKIQESPLSSTSSSPSLPPNSPTMAHVVSALDLPSSYKDSQSEVCI